MKLEYRTRKPVDKKKPQRLEMKGDGARALSWRQRALAASASSSFFLRALPNTRVLISSGPVFGLDKNLQERSRRHDQTPSI